MERKQKVRVGAPEEVQTSICQEVVILDRKISEVDIELHDATEDMRILAMERRQTELGGLRVSKLCR